MSRQAAAQSAKKEQKAALADKTAEKERQAALGMTPAWKRLIGDDEVLCMECGATKMGPTKCECKGGKKRPGKDDEPIPHLIAAAKERDATSKADTRLANASNQGAVQKERAKHRENRENEKNDLSGELQGNDIEILQNVEFPVGKLGMDIEGNSICKLSEGNAEGLGVKVGWVIGRVNDAVMPQKKADIVKAVAKEMKAGNPVKFGFRVPIMPGFHFCGACDKFLEEDKFDPEEISGKGPGKQMCYGCAEFADMADGFD